MDISKIIASNQKEGFISEFKGLADYYFEQQSLELHVYDETPNFVNSTLMSLTELNLQQIMQVSW